MVYHNKKHENLIFYWLLTNLILIFIMIIVGGLTRLTDSGLSITEWELFKGIIPPTNIREWELYFGLYKEIPQYKFLYSSMSIDQFKIIFYWEYAHRILGRLIGLFFLLPLLYFQFVKKIEFKKLLPFYIILFLIVLQGTIGWYMVKSGLVNDVTVSHYRLSIHLSMAVLILSLIFWQILNLRNKTVKSFLKFTKKTLPFFILIVLIFLQIIFGAFVSGLDAGRIYQTWPMMGETYLPNDIKINNFYDFLDFDNHSLVQFYHRNTAYIISIYILILSYLIFKNKKNYLYGPTIFLNFIFFIQIILGVLTLMTNLHISLASAHQITSVILALSSIKLYYSMIK